MKNKNLFYIIIIILLTISYSLSFFIDKYEGLSNSIETVLVNPKYKNNLTKIEIQQNDKVLQLDLKSNTGSFFLTDDEINSTSNNTKTRQKKVIQKSTFQIDKKRLIEFRKILTNNIIMYKISDDFSDWQIFSLHPGQNNIHLKIFGIKEQGNIGEIVSDLTFGLPNETNSMISLRNEVKPTIYYTNTEPIEQYLTTGINFWSTASLFMLDDITESEIKSIQIKNLSTKKDDFFNLNNKNFDSIRHQFFIAQSSNNVPINLNNAKMICLVEVSIVTETQKIEAMVYHTLNNDFLVIPKANYSCGKIISKWTYDNLFTKNH